MLLRGFMLTRVGGMTMQRLQQFLRREFIHGAVVNLEKYGEAVLGHTFHVIQPFNNVELPQGPAHVQWP